MTSSGECSAGWADRCARSTGRRCRCACGGANHGTARALPALPLFPQSPHPMPRANYRTEYDGPLSLVIRDVGPWDQHPSVTNDAELVVRDLAPTLNGRRLFYIDSDGCLDELAVRGGTFAGFVPGIPREVLDAWKATGAMPTPVTEANFKRGGEPITRPEFAP